MCACVLALVLGWMCHLVPAACHLLSGGLYISSCTTLHSVCACVLALVLGWMVPAACKDVSSSIRWQLMYFTSGLLLLYIVCVLALVLGWMCHLVPAACKDVSSWPLYKLMYFTRVCYYFT